MKKEWLDPAFKIIVVLGILLNAWLSQNYVTRDEHNKLAGQVQLLSETLIRMERFNETNTRQDTALADHETRIRQLEVHAERRN